MSLWKRHPLPWRVEVMDSVRNSSRTYRVAGGYIVYDALGEVVLHGGTYTGDGDEIQDWYWDEVIELVERLNA